MLGISRLDAETIVVNNWSWSSIYKGVWIL